MVTPQGLQQRPHVRSPEGAEANPHEVNGSGSLHRGYPGERGLVSENGFNNDPRKKGGAST